MANYAIMRIEKRRDLGAVRRCADHHLRAADTPNADPAGTIQVLAGSSDARDVAALIRDATKPLMKRKDAIRAMDVFCGASPEFFAAGGSIRDFEKRAMTWAADTFGADNIALAVTHEDELTPHVQLLITPITPDGRLAASHWLDGPKKLEALQDSFAVAMQPLGLERGVRGSKARHEDVKRWYSELAPRMQRAEARIEQAQKIIDAASLAEAELADIQASIAADRTEMAKLRESARRVETYQANQAKANAAKAAKNVAAEAAIREEIEKLKTREIALKSAEKISAEERPKRIAAERKVVKLESEIKVLADDKNELQNSVLSMKKALKKYTPS